MDSCENLSDVRAFSSQLRLRAASAIVEFEGAISDLSTDGNDAQRERMRSAAETMMKLSARVLIELE
jgi:hypothetical protein